MSNPHKELVEVEARIAWCVKRLQALKYERELINRELWRAQVRSASLQQRLEGPDDAAWDALKPKAAGRTGRMIGP